MLRNEVEYRNARKQIEELRSELGKRKTQVEREVSRATVAVADALRMKVRDIEQEIDEYEDLKEGRVSTLTIDDFDDLGELVTKARIARGWSQADLAEELDMESQQIQRYERNDWEKISLWRLQEIVETLGFNVRVQARLNRQSWNQIHSHLAKELSEHKSQLEAARESAHEGVRSSWRAYQNAAYDVYVAERDAARSYTERDRDDLVEDVQHVKELEPEVV
jgi:ribosome-binding protein aMBF1 (putative translation factor)